MKQDWPLSSGRLKPAILTSRSSSSLQPSLPPVPPTPISAFLLSSHLCRISGNTSSLQNPLKSMISLLLLAPVLAGQTAASPDSALLLNRDTIPATTGCPDDWPLCGDSVCYNPIEGQTCCPGRTCKFIAYAKPKQNSKIHLTLKCFG